MTFTGIRCDECKTIQGESNHWTHMQVWTDKDGRRSVALGPIVGSVLGAGDFTMATHEMRDLCGQACAVRHIAKLLGWSATQEEQS